MVMDWTTLQVVLAVSGIVLLAAALVSFRPLRRRWQAAEVRRALREFKLQRERLEAKFFDLAASLGKPRGLRWIECDWQNRVTFARDTHSGLLTAFVAVNIRFEAIAGGEMEDVAAVGTVRDAAAVFHYQRGRWGTGGRALFNMNPEDALTRLQGQFEPVAVEPRMSPV
jgi:hypothetical protein